LSSGSKQLICCSGFVNLKDLQNLVHSFDPAPIFIIQTASKSCQLPLLILRAG
jgi:hypothetical protein